VIRLSAEGALKHAARRGLRALCAIQDWNGRTGRKPKVNGHAHDLTLEEAPARVMLRIVKSRRVSLTEGQATELNGRRLQTGDKKRSSLTAFYEWGFVVILGMLCIALTVLQYRWTGQISRAEAEQLKVRLGEGLQSVCASFDATVSRGYRALTPDADEIDEAGFQEAHLQLFEAWKATKPPDIFKRIAYAVPEGDSLSLYVVQQEDGQLMRSEWPVSWKEIEANLAAKLVGAGASPPFVDASGTVVEFPVFSKRPSGGPGPPRERPDGYSPSTRDGRSSSRWRPQGRAGEKEWAILELDLDYVRNVWLPALLKTHLGPNQTDLLARVQVKTRTAPEQVLFEWAGVGEAPSGKPVKIEFHSNERSLTLGPRGRDKGSGGWVFEAWPRPNRLAELVSATQRRNLAIALMLNVLLMAAGVTLVRYTRRSRRLAEARMRFVANVSHELRTPLTTGM